VRKIFRDLVTTAAAIDSLVHHCSILELTGSSYRTDKALNQNQEDPIRRRNEPGRVLYEAPDINHQPAQE
jgi:hypothetical protein